MPSSTRPRRARCTKTLYLALIAMTLSATHIAHANPVVAIRFGLLDHATTVISNGIENGADVNIELLFDPTILPAFVPWSPYPVVGASFNFDKQDTDQIYAGLMWEWMITDRVFFHLTGGIALHDGELHRNPNDGQRALGQRLLLRGSVEIGRRFGQHHSLAIVYDHISNGPFGGPNKGIDNLGVRYSYFLR